MIQIHIENKTSVFKNINKEFLADLREQTKAFDESARYSKLYKNGIWDGFNYYLTKRGEFASGLLPLFVKRLKLAEIEYDLVDLRNVQISFKTEIKQFSQYTFYEYQEKAIKAAKNYVDNIPWNRGIFNCATNSGKNLIMAGVIQQSNADSVLILIHNQLIFEQAIQYFTELFGESEVSIINSKNKQIPKTRIVISMVKVLHNLRQSAGWVSYLNNIQMVFCDESHIARGKTVQELFLSLDTESVYFMSGTPLSFGENDKYKVLGLSGPILYSISNTELMQKNVSMKAEIFFIENKKGKNEMLDYDKQYSENIIYSKDRLEFLIDYCKKHKEEQILVSVIFKEHGEFLESNLLFEGIDCVFINSEDKNKAEIVEFFKQNKIKILISTLIIKEGVNIPNIQTLFYMLGGKAEISIKQLFGRLIRKDGTDNTVKVFDFIDRFKWLENHSLKRMEIYKKEGLIINKNYQ